MRRIPEPWFRTGARGSRSRRVSRCRAICLLVALLLPGAGAAGAREPRDCAGRNGVWRVIPVASLAMLADGYPDLGLRDGEVALTFDDGPSPQQTAELLDILAAACARATFFLLGQAAEAEPALARRIGAAGHAIGTHTHSHPNLPTLPPAEAFRDIERGHAAVRAAMAPMPVRLFRFPYLADSPALLAGLRRAGLRPIRADIAGEEWAGHSCSTIVERLMGALGQRRQGVILLHDTLPHAGCITRDLLGRLRAGGYRLVLLAG